MNHFLKNYSLYAAWLIAAVATLASLYYSEIKEIYPCKFCWYQRIFLFPLPLLLFPIVFFQRKDLIPYIISLPIIGLFIPLYQLFIRPVCCFSEPISPIASIITFALITLFLLIALFSNKKNPL